MTTFGNSLGNLGKQTASVLRRAKVFWVLGSLLVGFILIGAWIYARIEGHSYLDSFFYCVMIMTTIGAKDFDPASDAGKLFVAAYSLASTGLFVGTLTGLSQAIIIQANKREGGG